MKGIKYSYVKALFILCSFIACSPSNSEQASNSSEFVSKSLSNPDFTWITTSTDGFDIYTLEGSFATEKIDKLKTGLVKASASILGRFELNKPEEKTAVFFINSREQMDKLVGHPAGGWAAVRDNAIFYVVNKDNNPQLKHELGHLYTWTNWGEPHHYWLSEGMAVLSSGSCKDENFHAWASLLKRTKKLSSVKDLELQDFDFSKVEPHLQAASLMAYIEESYGLDTLQKVWKNGVLNWSEENETTIGNFEEAWLDNLEKPEFYKPHLKMESPIFCE